MDWLGQGALSDSTTWGLILGTVLPPLTAVVQQPRWTDAQRKIIAVLVAVLGGVLTCLANGALDEGQTVLATIAAVLVASQAAYRNLWKDSVASAIEAATSPHAKRRRQRRKPVTPVQTPEDDGTL